MTRDVEERTLVETGRDCLDRIPLDKIKVLQIAPVVLPISSKLKYAGTERVIWNLDNKLFERGIISQVAATANSQVTGQLLPTLDVNIWSYTKDNSEVREQNVKHSKKVMEYIRSENPDVIHDHDSGFTLHGDIDITEIDKPFLSTLHYSDVYEKIPQEWKNLPQGIKDKTHFIAISLSQKKRLEERLNIPVYRVIYHGLDLKKFPYSEEKKNYLLSVGVISSQKGQDLAIKTARETGNNLIIAGPVQTFNQEKVKFYEEEIETNLDANFSDRTNNLREIIELIDKEKGKIFYVGSVNDQERNLLNQYAKAFLMPQRWEEAFGLVMIEAMACGNPVIAFNKGSIPEIVRDGKNGYVVSNVKEMINRVERIKEIKPYDCRRDVEKRFNLEKQVDEYIDAYKSIID